MAQNKIELISTASSFLPDFDGSHTNFQSFIDALELLDSIKGIYEATAISLIKTKLKGSARNLISSEVTIQQIILRLKSTIKRDSVEVITAKLHNLRQGNDANSYASKIQELTKELETAYLSDGLPISVATKYATNSAVTAIVKNATNKRVKLIMESGSFGDMNEVICKFLSSCAAYNHQNTTFELQFDNNFYTIKDRSDNCCNLYLDSINQENNENCNRTRRSRRRANPNHIQNNNCYKNNRNRYIFNKSNDWIDNGSGHNMTHLIGHADLMEDSKQRSQSHSLETMKHISQSPSLQNMQQGLQSPNLPNIQQRQQSPPSLTKQQRSKSPSLSTKRQKLQSSPLPTKRLRSQSPPLPTKRQRLQTPPLPTIRQRSQSSSLPAKRQRLQSPSLPITRQISQSPLKANQRRSQSPSLPNVPQISQLSLMPETQLTTSLAMQPKYKTPILHTTQKKSSAPQTKTTLSRTIIDEKKYFNTLDKEYNKESFSWKILKPLIKIFSFQHEIKIYKPHTLFSRMKIFYLKLLVLLCLMTSVQGHFLLSLRKKLDGQFQSTIPPRKMSTETETFCLKMWNFHSLLRKLRQPCWHYFIS